MPFASSTVITPSFPTFSKASVIKAPIASSLFADTLATCLIFSEESPTETACFSKDLTIASTALSIPLLNQEDLHQQQHFLDLL